MRVAFLADNQVDERSRMEEHDRVMDFIAEDARARGCDVVLHGGDIYERRSTARERASIHAWVRKVTTFAPLVIAGGNHESPGEVSELEGIETGGYEVHAFERPSSVVLPNRDKTEWLHVDVLPWPRRANLHAWAGTLNGPSGRIWSREEIEAAAGDALRAVLRGLGAGHYFVSQRERAPRVLLAHAMVRGARQGPDQPLLGCDFELGLEDLALAEATVNLLGHVHMPQAWRVVGPCVEGGLGGEWIPQLGENLTIYAGSPRRTAYAAGELEPKGYVVLDFDGPRLVSWERVPTPATPMRLFEAEWIEGRFTGPLHEPVTVGCEVRFRFTVNAAERQAAGLEAAGLRDAWLDAGAAEVLVEEVVRPLSLARSPEVAAAPTLVEKLPLYWKARGLDLGEQGARVLGKVARLEEEIPCS